MVLKIRLARFGRRHAPFYNIVVAHARTARNSKPLEVIGTYDPVPRLPDPAHADLEAATKKQKHISLDTARARYWLGVGAQPSEPMARLLSMAGLYATKWSAGDRGEAEVDKVTVSEEAAEALRQE